MAHVVERARRGHSKDKTNGQRRDEDRETEGTDVARVFCLQIVQAMEKDCISL